MRRGLVGLACIGALALAGCATSEELASRDDAACTSYGYRVGTDGYANCRLSMDQQRQARRQAALMNMSASMQQQAAIAQANAAAYRPQPIQLPQHTNTNTTCMGLGSNMVSCNSTTN